MDKQDTSPQLKNTRRWFQFSLRTLLLLMMVVAVVTFLVVKYYVQYQKFTVADFGLSKRQGIAATAGLTVDDKYWVEFYIVDLDAPIDGRARWWPIFLVERNELRFELVKAENSKLVGILKVRSDEERRLVLIHDFARHATLPIAPHRKRSMSIDDVTRFEDYFTRLQKENPTLPKPDRYADGLLP